MLTSIYETAVARPDGALQGDYGGRYDMVEGLGFVACGRDLIHIDSTLLGLTEGWIEVAERVNREPVFLVEEIGLGASDTGRGECEDGCLRLALRFPNGGLLVHNRNLPRQNQVKLVD
ncbi:MAG TPA: hypothetical protein VM050_04625 [Patescibacteria group bacterium]|nr:hypothetical protein [Patescibacteria group bacterium]